MTISVNADGRTLSKNGNRFFYLADTCWSAFTSIEEKEWHYYLEKRKEQGFNTLQINILPQWDRSLGKFDLLPFSIDEKGAFNFERINQAYFERAEKMCEIATDNGFSLALVVLWSNYVYGTWASKLDEEKNIIPPESLTKYFEIVSDTFNQFSPIYFISGDTDFPNDKTVQTYDYALEYFKNESPECLKTLHIRGRYEEIPASLVEKIDIYLYQSGHNSTFLNMPYHLAKVFYDKNPKKPIINSEPCYEQMGYSRNVYGRFLQFDVRKAAWQSVLSGACAGISYGAHGIWSWQGLDGNYSSSAGEAFDLPLLWQDALKLPGSWDYGFLLNLLELFKVGNLVPCNELLYEADEQIRFAVDKENNCYLMYIPCNTTVKISKDFSSYKVKMVDLKTNNFITPKFVINAGGSVFKMHSCEEDVLLVMKQ
ncbi:apiosidase-like domain-containing protein [Vagococcus elongatus]|uniref:Apiosidase-like catalytic domain-containing protein n=1 Tax=Vagococcus elongatus TaxID=180344 RepID=A0A430AT75_9ENTE|nr:DUF4038 domain-containing protein [Vagococcus elongatus]RSU11253.1 hypothetical protein CBF29_08065 [Vagococcus elongatus]